MRKFLFATDGSDSSAKATEMVKTFLRNFTDSEVIVLHVVQLAYAADAMGFAAVPVTNPWEALASEIEQEVNKEFAEWADRIRFVSVTGTPSLSICQVAADEQVDLIIIGSHGRGAVDRLFLGSVSNAVVNRAGVPVLVVK